MDDRSTKREKDNEASGKLVGPQEKLILEQIAIGQPPYSQRAQALLAIDAGGTQAAAAEQSRQTVGQVKYWLGKFRRDRMSIFSEELLLQSEPEPPLEKKETEKKPKKVEASKKAKTKKKAKKVKPSKKEKKKIKNGKKKQEKKSKKKKRKPDKKK